MRGIDKSFGAVHALRGINFHLMPGEILGLVGDNSAGKSTLMKILTGAYQRDAGEILVDGKTTHFRSPHDSRDLRHRDDLPGLRAVREHGCRPEHLSRPLAARSSACSSTGRRCMREAQCVLKRLKVDVNSVYQKVESLSGGRQQSVAIARAISFNPHVVIFDEPTANLSVMATERLLETMAELKRQHVAQIIISHRMTDIFEVGDRVMVLKRGAMVGDRYMRHTTEREVLELIVSGTADTALTAEQALQRAA